MINILAISFFIINASICPIKNDTAQILKLILSKKYSSTYIVNSSAFNNNDSLLLKHHSDGMVKRFDNYVYSKGETIFCIYEDTNCLMIDTVGKRIDLGNISLYGTFLMSPSYDPYQIWKMANKFQTDVQEYTDGNNLVYHFQFPKDNPLFYQATFALNIKDDVSKLKVELKHRMLDGFVTEEIEYKIAPLLDRKHLPSIRDYIETKNGRNLPKSKSYQNYVFFGRGYAL